ncbi:hypothetical protein DVDV_1661 [Desulfovibrio sp. DV]|uniref:hypothetical protein n=1 Tax=Desulfovibrio sp. DV TaxID=1844708 RepID=UPI00094B9148|nr:hypothetical protein [Desulfovibrio sp. DV]OLN28280.1 hypothetical protein DVDV_1661 [Desulfovibrio sp. DV]
MAEKKVVLLLAGDVSLGNGGNALKKFTKKGVVATAYSGGDVAGEARRVPGAVMAGLADLAASLEAGAGLVLVDLGEPDAAGLETALGHVLEIADRRTLVVLAAANALVFYGLGINTKIGTMARPAQARDVTPTLAHIADLPLPDDATGAILYQALKETNLKLTELGKLREALSRMEAALQRDNREPWDKHDCA